VTDAARATDETPVDVGLLVVGVKIIAY